RRVRWNVEIAQPHLAVLDHGVGVTHLSLAFAQRLHLGAAELDAGLDLLDELELEPGAPVRRHIARGRGALLFHLLRHGPTLSPGEGHPAADRLHPVDTDLNAVTQA